MAGVVIFLRGFYEKLPIAESQAKSRKMKKGYEKTEK